MNGRTEQLVERAVTWATAQLGSTAWALRCLSFVEDAFEVPNGIEVFGGSTARESADLFDAGSAVGEPPRGSFVFFDTAGVVDGVLRPWGHVGLALGDGRMVHTWPEVRIDAIADLPSLPAGGWSAPRYLGWAGPEVVVRWRPAGRSGD